MARRAALGRFGSSVAAEAARGINVAIDAMARQIIALVGHQAARIAVGHERWFHGRALGVAVTAKTRLVAHGAYLLAAHGGQPVILSKERGVFEAPEREAFGFALVAVRTGAQIALFPGMRQGQAVGPGPLGWQQKRAEQYYGEGCDAYSFQYAYCRLGISFLGLFQRRDAEFAEERRGCSAKGFIPPVSAGPFAH